MDARRYAHLMSHQLEIAFASDIELFTPLLPLQPGDTLSEDWEPGQTFEAYINAAIKRPNKVRNVIYVQPLEPFIQDQSPPLNLLQQYIQAYFGLPVKLLPVLTQGNQTFPTRQNQYTNTQQVLTTAVLQTLTAHIPADAFCVMAISMQDLYSSPTWNFVFGQTSLEQRVGIFSFARYDPAFYGIPRDEGYRLVLLRRCCKLLMHELGHIFGLAHCMFYCCSMNGSEHVQESDARPMHLCPICLQKLHYSIGFDVVERYRQLQQFFKSVRFDEETQWVGKCLGKLGEQKTATRL
jgi:archaemetzincin